ncbi:MAG: hypothetical protein QME74_01420 [Candidatus Edwardsbacteria bacterium]|nr:hypothetical protein [Candidatus Edwardsbacteria bacterium]
METITKAWWHGQVPEGRPCQRSIGLLNEHRARWGTSGNCFDLLFWLMDAYRQNRIDCFAIGTPDDHVAVVALDEHGDKYLCDLGDQWLQPALIDPASPRYDGSTVLEQFFPGARVRLRCECRILHIEYLRPGGHVSSQDFDLTPLNEGELVARAEATQHNPWGALCERRIELDGQRVHWEFENDKSFFSTNEGLMHEPPLSSTEEWAERIADRSGIHRDVVIAALEKYKHL